MQSYCHCIFIILYETCGTSQLALVQWTQRSGFQAIRGKMVAGITGLPCCSILYTYVVRHFYKCWYRVKSSEASLKLHHEHSSWSNLSSCICQTQNSIRIKPQIFDRTHTHTHTHLTALFPGLPRWAGTRKVTPIWIFVKQETVSGNGISWAVCKCAPHSRQITTPAPHYSVFLQAGCPTNSVKALKATNFRQNCMKNSYTGNWWRSCWWIQIIWFISRYA